MPKQDLDWDQDDWPRKRSRRREDEDEDEDDRPRKRKRRVKAGPRNTLPLVVGLVGGGFLLLLVVGAMVAMLLLWKGGGSPSNPVAAVGVPPVVTEPPPPPRVPGPPPPPKPLPPAVTPPGYLPYDCDYFSMCTKRKLEHVAYLKTPPKYPASLGWQIADASVGVNVYRLDAAFLAEYQRDWAGALDRFLERDQDVKVLQNAWTTSWSDCTLSGISGRQLTGWNRHDPVSMRSYWCRRYVVKGELLFIVSGPGPLAGGLPNPDSDAVFDNFRIK